MTRKDHGPILDARPNLSLATVASIGEDVSELIPYYLAEIRAATEGIPKEFFHFLEPWNGRLPFNNPDYKTSDVQKREKQLKAKGKSLREAFSASYLTLNGRLWGRPIKPDPDEPIAEGKEPEEKYILRHNTEFMVLNLLEYENSDGNTIRRVITMEEGFRPKCDVYPRETSKKPIRINNNISRTNGLFDIVKKVHDGKLCKPIEPRTVGGRKFDIRPHYSLRDDVRSDFDDAMSEIGTYV